MHDNEWNKLGKFCMLNLNYNKTKIEKEKISYYFFSINLL